MMRLGFTVYVGATIASHCSWVLRPNLYQVGASSGVGMMPVRINGDQSLGSATLQVVMVSSTKRWFDMTVNLMNVHQ